MFVLLQMMGELDLIAEQCCQRLKIQSPNHPVLSTKLIPASHTLSESMWSLSHSRQLFKCINHVLFVQVSAVSVAML